MTFIIWNIVTSYITSLLKKYNSLDRYNTRGEYMCIFISTDNDLKYLIYAAKIVCKLILSKWRNCIL